MITNDTAFDLGHNDNRTKWVGPECVACNRAAGAVRPEHTALHDHPRLVNTLAGVPAIKFKIIKHSGDNLSPFFSPRRFFRPGSFLGGSWS